MERAIPQITRKVARDIGCAIYDFEMIKDGDRILVGLSGGKDSWLLLSALRRLELRSPVRFGLCAVTIDPVGDTDFSELSKAVREMGVEHSVISYPIFKVLESGASDSACSLCANLRRGILATAAKERDCTVLALGHHADDAAETVLLNLSYAGRFRCFRPHMTMSRTGVRVIRPLVYVRENAIIREAEGLRLPLIDFVCPYSARSKRALVKQWIKSASMDAPYLVSNTLHALKHCREGDVWSLEEVE